MELTAAKTTAITTELANLATDAHTLAKASKAPRTIKSYESDLAGFETWCDDNDLTPMPASVATVTLYVTWASKRHKVTTIRRRLAAIAEAHKAKNEPIPTRDPRIGTLLKGITNTQAAEAKANGASSLDRQAKALDAFSIVTMISHIKGDSMAAIRDRALIAIGFAGFLRRSELVALTVENLEWSENEVRLHVATSKTDQAGHGAVIRIESGDAVSPPALLREWLEASGITEGPIFRGVYRSGKLRETGLTGRNVSRILKARAEAAGIDPELVSGHSLRRGAATAAYRQGADALAISRRGRWADNSKTLARYIESSAADSIDLGL